MIQVDYDRRNYALSVYGHACFSDCGTDIVCSASSILAYALAAELTALEEKGYVTDLQLYFDKGVANITCRLRAPRSAPVVYAAFDTAAAGYRLLAKNYPENIAIKNF